MRSNRIIYKILCDCCNQTVVEYGNGEIQHKTKGWLHLTITSATTTVEKERDICPACADVITNTIRGGGPAWEGKSK